MVVFLAVFSSAAFSDDKNSKICEPNTIKDLVKMCKKGDVIYIAPTWLGLVCDFSKSIVEQPRSGGNYICIYRGSRRD